MMHASILRQLSVRFDETNIKSSRARAKYKCYADRYVIHPPIFKEGEYVLVQRPPKESKTAKEKEEDIAHHKLRYKMTGPYPVVASTLKNVTVDHNGEHVIVSNDRCIQDPKLEPEDPDRQVNAKDITGNDENNAKDPTSTTVEDKRITPHRRPTVATIPCPDTMTFETSRVPRVNRTTINPMTTNLCRHISISNTNMIPRLTSKTKPFYDRTQNRISSMFPPILRLRVFLILLGMPTVP